LTHECQSKYIKPMTTPHIQPYIDAIQSVSRKATEKEKTEKAEDLSALPRSLVIQTHPSSNTKVAVVRFLLDRNVVARNNDLVVGYTCLHCGVRNDITLNLYIRKVSKNIRCCNACKNQDAQKRSEHSAYMLGERDPAPKETQWKEKPLAQRVDESDQMFREEDSEFQTSYFLQHFTVDEFARVRGKLLSVGNGKLTDLSGWAYLPHYRVWNQTKFTPMLVHLESNRIEKPAYVQWRCEECDALFTNRDLEVQKNKYRILCLDCGFCNRTFKVRSMTTPFGKLRYQSVQERRCIEWCVEKGIPIENGPKLSYTFDSRTHWYKVDFQLPSLRVLLELKDNHIWHNRQVQSGKWGNKEAAARGWAAAHGWTYDMVFPKTWSKWKEDILVRYSLTLQETVRSKDKEPCDNTGGNL